MQYTYGTEIRKILSVYVLAPSTACVLFSDCYSNIFIFFFFLIDELNYFIYRASNFFQCHTHSKALILLFISDLHWHILNQYRFKIDMC